MLRVGMGPQAPQAQAPEQQPDPAALMEQIAAASQPSESQAPMKHEMDKLRPEVARYMGPEMGPFACSNCEYFDGQGGCSVVSGPIDPNGFCIVFTPVGGGDEAEQTDNPEEEASEPGETEEQPKG